MLESLDRPDPSLGDAGHHVEGEIGNEAEGDDLALIVGQERQGGDQLGIERFVGRRRRGVPVAVDLSRSAGPPAGVVDETVPGDGEHPAPQLVMIASEPREVARHLEEDLAEKIFGIAGALGPQVAQHRRGEVAIDVLGI